MSFKIRLRRKAKRIMRDHAIANCFKNFLAVNAK